MSASQKRNVFLVFPLYNYHVIGHSLAEKGPLVILLLSVCVIPVVHFRLCKISGCHGGKSEDESLMEYRAM
jgi:hypothetical protein